MYFDTKNTWLQQSFGTGTSLLYGNYSIDFAVTDYNCFSITHDGTDGRLYINGNLGETINSGYSAGSEDVYIGQWSHATEVMYMSCLELRISSTARSDAWIKATSASLHDDLLTFGDEESVLVPVQGVQQGVQIIFI